MSIEVGLEVWGLHEVGPALAHIKSSFTLADDSVVCVQCGARVRCLYTVGAPGGGFLGDTVRRGCWLVQQIHLVLGGCFLCWFHC